MRQRIKASVPVEPKAEPAVKPQQAPLFMLSSKVHSASASCGNVPANTCLQAKFESVDAERTGMRTMVGDFVLSFHAECHPEFTEYGEGLELGALYQLVKVTK